MAVYVATVQLFYFAPTVQYECIAALEQTGDSASHLEVFKNCTVSFSDIGCSRFTSNTLTCTETSVQMVWEYELGERSRSLAGRALAGRGLGWGVQRLAGQLSTMRSRCQGLIEYREYSNRNRHHIVCVSSCVIHL